MSRLGALLLLAGTVVAIAWANLLYGSYHGFWETHLTVGLGDLLLDFTLYALVNDALMAVFFFTVGLEVRMELAIGELTTWSRAVVPVVAAVAGSSSPPSATWSSPSAPPRSMRGESSSRPTPRSWSASSP